MSLASRKKVFFAGSRFDRQLVPVFWGLYSDACHLRPEQRYILQVVDLTGNLLPVLGTIYTAACHLRHEKKPKGIFYR